MPFKGVGEGNICISREYFVILLRLLLLFNGSQYVRHFARTSAMPIQTEDMTKTGPI